MRLIPTPTLLVVAALLAVPSLAAQGGRHRDRDDESEEYQSRIDTTLTLARDGTVDLSLISGKITVTGWDRSEVKIHAVSERGVLRLDASPSRVAVGVRSERGNMGDTEYDVSIPAGVRLIMRSVSGDISSRGGGEVEAHSVSGDVEVADATSRATLESVSGTVKGRHIGGAVRANCISGDITLEDVGGDVEAETVSGEITLSRVRAKYVRSETVSGDVRFSGTIDREGRYEFHSHSGDIVLDLPADAGAQFSVETFSGSVDSDVPITVQPGREHGRGQHLEFTQGGGGARFTVETFSGDIVIQHRGSGRSDREE